MFWDVQFYQTCINVLEHSSFPMELLLVNILLKYIVNISNILFNLFFNYTTAEIAPISKLIGFPIGKPISNSTLIFL